MPQDGTQVILLLLSYDMERRRKKNKRIIWERFSYTWLTKGREKKCSRISSGHGQRFEAMNEHNKTWH